MVKLTDMQLKLLAKASARDDGAAIVPAKTPKPTATKLAASLVGRKLMREMRAKAGMPVWRKDGDGRGVSLVITRAGRDAIAVRKAAKKADKADVLRRSAAESPHRPVSGSSPPSKLVGDSRRELGSEASWAGVPRRGSKLALVIEMLTKPEGATIAALVSATGWQPHTARAVLTGLRKRGFAIERARVDGAASSLYRIASTASLAA
ncbi:MAG TPA: DUF3489 domain-containing protein [Rhodomicrobium sp.]|nr:DUF3489 domain-containing protein [Rhodomicrobium sp.]